MDYSKVIKNYFKFGITSYLGLTLSNIGSIMTPTVSDSVENWLLSNVVNGLVIGTVGAGRNFLKYKFPKVFSWL